MSRSAHRVFRAISAPFAGGAYGGNGSRIGAEGVAVAPKRAHKTLMIGGSVCPFGARHCRFVLFGFWVLDKKKGGDNLAEVF